MPWLDPQPANTATSKGFSFTSQIRVADPFDPANITWQEVVASTSEEWAGFQISYFSLLFGMVHVAIGAAGSEQIIATVPTSVGNQNYFSISVPVAISAGTRVSVGASQNSSGDVFGQIVGVPSAGLAQLPPYSRLDCGPFDLSNVFGSYGRGTTIDPGATANTKGAWTELSLSAGNVLNGDALANDYDWFGFLFSDTSQVQTSQDRLWDIATGASGSEVAVVTNLYDYYSNNEKGLLELAICWSAQDVAMGTRISARMQSSITDATDRLGRAFMFGLR